jgi:hypothetical protein
MVLPNVVQTHRLASSDIASVGVAPSVHLRVGRHLFGARPVVLRGHEATVALDQFPTSGSEVRLVLTWEDGSRTELPASLRAVEESRCLAHLDLRAVEGDWRPFLRYLGGTLRGAATT